MSDAHSRSTVVFNVGGRHFEVFKHIIESRPTTLLANLLDDISFQDDSRPIFVDANPDRFAHVLDWYRYGEMYVDGEFAKEAVLRDARYFLLPNLVKVNGEMHALNCADSQGVFDSVIGSTLAEWPTFYDYVHERIAEFQRDLEHMRAQNASCLQNKNCWSSSFRVSECNWNGHRIVHRWVDNSNVCTKHRLQLVLMELRRRGFDCDEQTEGYGHWVRIALDPKDLYLRRWRKYPDSKYVKAAGAYSCGALKLMLFRIAACMFITHLAVGIVTAFIRIPRAKIFEWHAAGAKHSSSVPDAICVGAWWGRLGNNFNTLLWAIHAAVEMNVLLIRFPETNITVQKKAVQVFDVARIPRTWTLRHSATERQTGALHCAARCDDFAACSLPNKTRATSRAFRGLPSQLLHRYVTDAGLLRCNELTAFEPPGNDVLTMHMRSGDTLNMTHQEWGLHRLAPCAFWTSAFQSSGFRSALIVTEPDRRHPCVRAMMERFPGRVVVQSNDLLGDFCTLLNSRNLAFSQSTFAAAVVTLSTTIRTVYAASWYVDKYLMRSSFLENCFSVSCPGYPKNWSRVSQKMDSMLNYPAESTSIRRIDCGQLNQTK